MPPQLGRTSRARGPTTYGRTVRIASSASPLAPINRRQSIGPPDRPDQLRRRCSPASTRRTPSKMAIHIFRTTQIVPGREFRLREACRTISPLQHLHPLHMRECRLGRGLVRTARPRPNPLRRLRDSLGGIELVTDKPMRRRRGPGQIWSPATCVLRARKEQPLDPGAFGQPETLPKQEEFLP